MQTELRPLLVTEEEARRYLGGISRALIYKLRADGVIHPVHLGRACRYRLEDLDSAIRSLADGDSGTIGRMSRPNL